MTEIRLDCPSCGYHLGHMSSDGGTWNNVDSRPQPTPPRLELVQHAASGAKWVSRCKCRANTQVLQHRLERALDAVAAAGLQAMPMKGLG
jgi:hypothetical protein